MNPKKETSTLENIDFSNIDDNLRKLIKSNDILFIIYLLKNMSDEDHTFKSVSDMAKELSGYFLPVEFDAREGIQNRTKDVSERSEKESIFAYKTLSTRINAILSLYEQDDPLSVCIQRLFSSVFGGQIKTKILPGKKSASYYFDPLLSLSDLDMIVASIESNKYLSEAEKEYLISRMNTLNPVADFRTTNNTENNHIACIDEMPDLAKRPAPVRSATLPVETSKLLHNISLIHEAIANNRKIEIIYGEYSVDASFKGKLSFKSRLHNEHETTVLNPYAMLWSKGQYYLLATIPGENDKSGVPQIYHYRIDRIMSVSVLYQTLQISKNEKDILKRDKIPAALSPYFKKRDGKYYFDSIKYTSTYPHMYFYNEKDLVNATIECTNFSLSLLIDDFGTDITVSKSPIIHTESVDSYGRPVVYLLAKIRNVQYDSLIHYVSTYHTQLTLIEAFGSDGIKVETSDIINKKLSQSAKKYLNK